MSFDELFLPARLSRIDGKEADQLVRMLCNILGDIPVRNPHAGELRFAAEDNCFVAI